MVCVSSSRESRVLDGKRNGKVETPSSKEGSRFAGQMDGLVNRQDQLFIRQIPSDYASVSVSGREAKARTGKNKGSLLS